ncbi:MFS transporter [Streptomyces sp. SID3212]|uniref:MFS transporter n=1 Tax=Streptomyces sp. SID3212 TaxID=2690259 RepID=UPI0013688B9C|nr:MFS transporter [Streptomyces sp. SID3212]MYV53462.1 MFS transporter [Streptomyces sp. SID3212]
MTVPEDVVPDRATSVTEADRVGPVDPGGIAPGKGAALPGRARWAAPAPFLIAGLLFANYYLRMPSLKTEYALSNGQLGLFLLLPVVTGLVTLQTAGALVARFGSGPIARTTMVALPLSLAGIALAGDRVQFGAALLVFGAVNGLVDVSMNAHAIAVERALERPIMNSCHAAWSIGTMVGAVLGGIAVKTGLSFTQHFLLVSVVLAVIGAVAGRSMLPGSADQGKKEADGKRERVGWRDGWTPRVVVLGLTGTVVLVSESAVGDWSGIFLRDELGATLATASLAYIAFSFCQTGGRLVGDRLNQKYGPSVLVRWGGAIAVAGLTVVVFSPTPAVAVVGFGLHGAGLSVIVPIIFSAVGHGAADGETGSATAALAKVNTLTYGGFLAGPMLVGLFADGFGLTMTLAGLLVVLAVTVSTGLRRV